MSLSTQYNPAEVEDKWYAYWLKHDFFCATPDPAREPYSIVIPPPNVTGTLHMGHMLNSSIQDVLIRKARMEGKSACWIPGTDHASIATEARVVAMLKERGVRKSDLSRDEFLRHAWAWKERYGGKILEQLKKLGASCDWSRTSFTMDRAYYRAVIRVFVDLYNKGYIYRDFKMINWDTEARTALSNEEVVYAEGGEPAVLYTVRYALKDFPGQWIHVATQRPETIMGDVAIAVNADDERYRKWVGHKAIVPFIGREIPIIADSYVDADFGTGCLKVTPAHDVNDYEIGQRHNLPIIDTLDDDGRLNAACGIPKFVGKDRFVVRKAVVDDLRKADLLVAETEAITRIGRSERTQSVVEPRLSLQWFVKMESLSRRAYQAVEQDEIKLHPPKFKNMYRHWMENIRDWCVSRQLWWGQRIPAYFYGQGKDDFVVAETTAEAARLASSKLRRVIEEKDLRQDPDTLDTWMSSWLWPLAVLGGFEDDVFDRDKGAITPKPGSDLDYFYPTEVLVTAPEIIFFWVARMIIAGYAYSGKKPFSHVYLTGIVKDKQRRKMSKSLGNSPDPLELMARYGADGVRVGLLLCSAAGNDLLFEEKHCQQGRNFANKIWNAFRLVQGWKTVETPTSDENRMAVKWFEAALSQRIIGLQQQFAQFRISEALMAIYKLIWDDFCSHYLEMVKPAFGAPIDAATHTATISFFETVLKLLHPFMPFITEELWSQLAERGEKECILVADWPVSTSFDEQIIAQGRLSFALITQLRNIRNTHRLPTKKPLDLLLREKDREKIGPFAPIISKRSNLAHVRFVQDETPSSGVRFVIHTVEGTLLLEDTPETKDKEKATIEQEIAYTRGFLKSVEKKLQNPNFLNNAPPQVVAIEKKKKRDAESTLSALQKNLKRLAQH